MNWMLAQYTSWKAQSVRVCPRDISAALLDYRQRNDSSIVDHEITIKDDGRQKIQMDSRRDHGRPRAALIDFRSDTSAA
jgi:hypothetical protein